MTEAVAQDGGATAPESDLSPRKLKIALGCLIGQTFASYFLPVGAATFVLLPMTHEFHWSRTAYSFHTTAHMAFGACSAWLIGRYADRIGAKAVVIFGAVGVGLTTLAMSFQTANLVQFYLYYALFGFFGATWLAYMKIVAEVFTRHRGKAMAIVAAEQTVLTAFTPILTNALIQHLGWRGMYLTYGVVVLAVTPLLFVLLEAPQRTLAAPGQKRGPLAPPPIREGMTIGQVIRDGVFWTIMATYIIGMCITSGFLPHMIAAYVGKGFTPTQAAWTYSLSMLIGVPGMFLGGWLVDKVHSCKIAAPFNLISAAGAFLLLIVSASFGGMGMLVASGALMWFAMSGLRPMVSYFHSRFFGLRAYAEVTGLQFTIMNPIMALSAPIVGMIYDRTHSYDLLFKAMIVCPLISGLIWLVLPRYRYRADLGVVDEPALIGPEAAPEPAIAPAE